MVNDAFELRGLITVKDIIKTTEHPDACKDLNGALARWEPLLVLGRGPKNGLYCWPRQEST